ARGRGARRVGARSAEPRSRGDSGGTELSPEVTGAEVPERIKREAPTKEARRCHPGAAAGRGAGGGARS
ncbi:unnamed protein product, partial [Gulo gulo]